ncbi:hypothetical protein [Altererythrobacter sp. MF3-039]|uniref:hypothetical protein n=1 Tax=Altererythrobacter sp. MF3-039 TaxID=3252901 RepID=UPI00390C6290
MTNDRILAALRSLGKAFSILAIPYLAIVVWWDALDFDPNTALITLDGSPYSPTGAILFGCIILVLGLAAIAGARIALRKPSFSRGDILTVLWIGLWLAVLGAGLIATGMLNPIGVEL